MTNKILEKISEKYPLQEKDVGGFAKVKAKGLTFNITAYDAKGLGHVSIMQGKGVLGLAKVAIFTINPIEIDLPVYSYQLFSIASENGLSINVYDTLLGEYNYDKMNMVKSNFTHIPELVFQVEESARWDEAIKLDCGVYKRCSKKDVASLEALLLSHFEAYLDSSANIVPDVDREWKQRKAQIYVDGLLLSGAFMSDAFKQKIGESATEELVRKIILGIE